MRSPAAHPGGDDFSALCLANDLDFLLSTTLRALFFVRKLVCRSSADARRVCSCSYAAGARVRKLWAYSRDAARRLCSTKKIGIAAAPARPDIIHACVIRATCADSMNPQGSLARLARSAGGKFIAEKIPSADERAPHVKSAARHTKGPQPRDTRSTRARSSTGEILPHTEVREDMRSSSPKDLRIGRRLRNARHRQRCAANEGIAYHGPVTEHEVVSRRGLVDTVTAVDVLAEDDVR
jgi:hypothetical protein